MKTVAVGSPKRGAGVGGVDLVEESGWGRTDEARGGGRPGRAGREDGQQDEDRRQGQDFGGAVHANLPPWERSASSVADRLQDERAVPEDAGCCWGTLRAFDFP